MSADTDLQFHIEHEFGLRLEPLGFQRVGPRKWVRSRNLPIREFFVVGALKGAQYCPSWGLSSGFVPSFRAQTFRRQSTEKNAVRDLTIDPIDRTGNVPPESFSYIPGHHNWLPIGQIRVCAEHFIPQALADFDRVRSARDFCEFFLERTRREHGRFLFRNYLAYGFVLILTGRRDEGLEKIREFCRRMDTEFEDPVLSEHIRHAESHQIT